MTKDEILAFSYKDKLDLIFNDSTSEKIINALALDNDSYISENAKRHKNFNKDNFKNQKEDIFHKTANKNANLVMKSDLAKNENFAKIQENKKETKIDEESYFQKDNYNGDIKNIHRVKVIANIYLVLFLLTIISVIVMAVVSPEIGSFVFVLVSLPIASLHLIGSLMIILVKWDSEYKEKNKIFHGLMALFLSGFINMLLFCKI